MVDTLEDFMPQDFWDLAPVLPDDFNDNEIVTIPKAVDRNSTVETKASGEKGNEEFPYTNFLINEADNQSSTDMNSKKQLIQELEEENHSNMRVDEMECSWPEIKEKKQSNIDFKEMKDASCKADKEEMENQGVRKKIKSGRRRSSKSEKKQKQANCKTKEKHSCHEDGKSSSQLLRENWHLNHQRNEEYRTSQGINDQMYINGNCNAMHQPVVSNINNAMHQPVVSNINSMNVIELHIIRVLSPKGKHGRTRHLHEQFLYVYKCRPVNWRERRRFSRLPTALNIDWVVLFVFGFILFFYSMIS
ncbi:uncharacterized protein LOC125047248 [Penaeus chinensis]|uniref:uncharacterized protein LOC125047248 n=1 Tax=Penaeus chinensis TaxID=139456 RepID=UPI001FB678B5|nr:uncharacterized protein LOC125047248 [Penaeus chinensis]